MRFQATAVFVTDTPSPSRKIQCDRRCLCRCWLLLEYRRPTVVRTSVLPEQAMIGLKLIVSVRDIHFVTRALL